MPDGRALQGRYTDAARTARPRANGPAGAARYRSSGATHQGATTQAGGPLFAGGWDTGTNWPERSRGTRHGEARASRADGSQRPKGPVGGGRGTEAKRPKKTWAVDVARDWRAASKKGAADGGAGDQRRPRFCMAAERFPAPLGPPLPFPPFLERPQGANHRAARKGGKERGATGGEEGGEPSGAGMSDGQQTSKRSTK